MGPPAAIPLDRRQTFPSRGAAHQGVTGEPVGDKFCCSVKASFEPEDLSSAFECSARRETFVKVSKSMDSWTPQRLSEDRMVRRTWGGNGHPPFSEPFAGWELAAHKSEEEEELAARDDLDNLCSFQLGSFTLSPPRDKPAEVVALAVGRSSAEAKKKDVPAIVVETCKDQPLNLSVKRRDGQPSVYQPEVSDIR